MDNNQNSIRSNKNGNNSSSIQCLLDTITISTRYNKNEIIELSNQLMEKLSAPENAEMLREIDNIFRRPHYNEKKRSFVKLKDIKHCQNILNISPASAKVLVIMIQSMSQDNLVSFNLDSFAKICKMGKRTLEKCISELKQTGIVAIYSPAKKRIGQSTIYMLNPKMVNASKYEDKQSRRFRSDYSLVFDDNMNCNDDIIVESVIVSYSDKDNQRHPHYNIIEYNNAE